MTVDGPGRDPLLPPPDLVEPPPATTAMPPPVPAEVAPTTGPLGGQGESTSGQAKAAASEVAQSARDGARDVAAEATDQAKAVAGQARQQVQRVVGQAGEELRARADEQSARAAGGLRTLSGHVGALAEGRAHEAGPLVGYLHEAQGKIDQVADRLQTGGPQGVMDDVAAFARRRPGLFLLAAAGCGFVAGRLARSGTAADPAQPASESSARPTGAGGPTTVPTGGLSA